MILAVYTYQSGLRAPALIAFVKDILIYIVILVAVIWLPARLGGWSAIFGAASDKLAQPSPATGRPQGSILLTANNQLQYVTLALGSALALFLYPHSLTGILASRGRNVIKRNMMALPAYSLLLGLLALLGYVAIAAGAKPITNNATGRPDTNTIIPVLFDQQFNSLFAGIAFAAIGIGALVPAAIMSIAAANLWTRNIYKEYLRRDATPAQEAKQAKLASLVVKFGAVLFIVAVDPQFSIDLQLIGGVIILQTLPAVAIALYTRWLHRWALVAGWAVGMGYGLYLLYLIPNPAARPGALRRLRAGAGQADPARLAPVRRLAGADLRRLRGAAAQPDRRRGPHPAAARPAGGRGVRRDGPARLPRRRGVADLRPVAAPIGEGGAPAERPTGPVTGGRAEAAPFTAGAARRRRSGHIADRSPT